MAITIGFVGLGKMGGAISANLLASGHSVVGCDLSPARLRELRALGGEVAATPEEAAARSGMLMISVPGDKDVEKVLLGKGGAVGGLKRGAVVTDFSTLLPSTSRRMAEALKKIGAHYLDTPISGNRVITRKRGGTLMAGGDPKAFKKALPILREITHRQFYLGTSGKGALGKLVMNTVSELNRISLAEGLAFGMAGGIEGKVLLEFLASGSAYSKQIDHKGTRMVTRDFKDPEGTIEMCVKDAEHMLHTARELGVPMPMTALRCQLYHAIVRMGYASDDPASIFALYDRISGGKAKVASRSKRGRKRGAA